MKCEIFTITGLVLLGVLIAPNIGLSTTEKRYALVIGNGAYKTSPLRNSVNDAYDMAKSLRGLGFEVIHKENASRKDMKLAIRDFGKRLRKGGVGLFFFAGHGIQVNGRNYLIPVDARIETESDVEFEAVDAGRILGKMEDAENELNIVILDACRDNPYSRSFRTSTRGLARMDAPTGSFIAYATAPGSVAIDGSGRNGVFTGSLLKNMVIPGVKIEDVLKRVRNEVIQATNGKQVPWQSSSLMGDFYFVVEGKITVTKVSPTEERTELEKERARLERERKELERLKAEIERKRIEEERKRLEEEKQKLEIAKLPSTPSLKEIARDGHFIAYDNGTVKDTPTGLMWASKDNGRNVTWQEAKEYCESYRGGGYTDWRMPTQDELAGLYDPNIQNTKPPTGGCKGGYHITNLINITCCCPWASDTRGSRAAYFDFGSGYKRWDPQSNSSYLRSLPVRSGN